MGPETNGRVNERNKVVDRDVLLRALAMVDSEKLRCSLGYTKLGRRPRLRLRLNGDFDISA
jgi:hypothetical protein